MKYCKLSIIIVQNVISTDVISKVKKIPFIDQLSGLEPHLVFSEGKPLNYYDSTSGLLNESSSFGKIRRDKMKLDIKHDLIHQQSSTENDTNILSNTNSVKLDESLPVHMFNTTFWPYSSPPSSSSQLFSNTQYISKENLHASSSINKSKLCCSCHFRLYSVYCSICRKNLCFPCSDR
jgi:hypothetical protein